MVDWDEDGLKDLLVGEESGYIRYYRNVGSFGNPSLTFDANLVANASPISVGSNSYPWVNDWNEDGLSDFVSRLDYLCLITNVVEVHIDLTIIAGVNNTSTDNQLSLGSNTRLVLDFQHIAFWDFCFQPSRD